MDSLATKTPASEDHPMEDVGKTKGSSGKETAEAIAYVLGFLLLLVIVYEVGSRFSVNDPTVTLYQQMKCCLWRSIVGARMDTLDDRLGDVEREMIRTEQELAIA